MDIYARENVNHAWLIDAQAKTLEVYRNQNNAWLRVGVWHDAAIVNAEPFADVPLPLDVLWTT